MTVREFFNLPRGAVIAYDEMQLLGLVFGVDREERRVFIRWSDGRDDVTNENDPEIDEWFTSFDQLVFGFR